MSLRDAGVGGEPSSERISADATEGFVACMCMYTLCVYVFVNVREQARRKSLPPMTQADNQAAASRPGRRGLPHQSHQQSGKTQGIFACRAYFLKKIFYLTFIARGCLATDFV